VVITGDQATDAQAVRQLVDRVQQQAAPARHIPRAGTLACTSVTNKQIGGSYLAKPDDPASTRISYQITYNVNTACAVSNVMDRTKTSGASLTWAQTCTGRNAQGTWTGCTTWNRAIIGVAE